MKRYELPQPPAGKITDVSAWQECVDNSQAQLEHQALRILNLQLMEDFGVTAWKTYNNTLVSMINGAQKQLQVCCELIFSSALSLNGGSGIEKGWKFLLRNVEIAMYHKQLLMFCHLVGAFHHTPFPFYQGIMFLYNRAMLMVYGFYPPFVQLLFDTNMAV